MWKIHSIFAPIQIKRPSKETKESDERKKLEYNFKCPIVCHKENKISNPIEESMITIPQCHDSGNNVPIPKSVTLSLLIGI